MKTYFVSGTYEYQDPIKINQVDYFFENIKWEAEINQKSKEILSLKLYEHNGKEYDYKGRFVNKLDKTITLYEEISNVALSQKPNIKHNISLFKKGTFNNPLNSNDIVVMDNKDNMGSFQIRQLDNDTFVIDVIKKITPNGLSVVMKHLCTIADDNNITLVKSNKTNNETMNSWYKANGFVMEDSKYIRHPK